MKDTSKTFATRAQFLLVSFVVGVAVALVGTYAQVAHISAKTFSGPASVPTTHELRVVGTGAALEVPGTPIRLMIPAIGVDAAIQEVGLSDKGTGDIGVPDSFTDVAWFAGSVLPGMKGSAIIDGHVDGKHVPKAVFYDLHKLQIGDSVLVEDSKDMTRVFRVTKIQTLAADDPTEELFATSTTSRVVLITCAGSWLKNKKEYNKRVVVFAERTAL